jgi:hypothetical protein
MDMDKGELKKLLPLDAAAVCIHLETGELSIITHKEMCEDPFVDAPF